MLPIEMKTNLSVMESEKLDAFKKYFKRIDKINVDYAESKYATEHEKPRPVNQFQRSYGNRAVRYNVFAQNYTRAVYNGNNGAKNRNWQFSGNSRQQYLGKKLRNNVRLPFGLVSSVAIFISMMNSLLGLETYNWMKMYVDDVCCHTTSFNEHLIRFEHILQILLTNGLALKLRKCKFALTEITPLGHGINGKEITIDHNKHEAILDYSRQNNGKQLQRWLGICNWHKKFINQYSTIMAPLYALLKMEENGCGHVHIVPLTL